MSGLSSPRRERNQIEKLKLGPQDWMGMTFRNLIGKRCWLSWCLGKDHSLKQVVPQSRSSPDGESFGDIVISEPTVKQVQHAVFLHTSQHLKEEQEASEEPVKVCHLEALEIAHMGLFIFSKGETRHNCWSLQSEGSGILKVT